MFVTDIKLEQWFDISQGVTHQLLKQIGPLHLCIMFKKQYFHEGLTLTIMWLGNS